MQEWGYVVGRMEAKTWLVKEQDSANCGGTHRYLGTDCYIRIEREKTECIDCGNVDRM